MENQILSEGEVEALFYRLVQVIGPDVVGLLLIELARGAIKKQLNQDTQKLLQSVLDELVAERSVGTSSGSPYR